MSNSAAPPALSDYSFSTRSTLWQGAFWKVVSCACFAGINGVVRYLSGGVENGLSPLSESVIMVFQNLFGVLLMLPWIRRMGVRSMHTRRPFLHFIRVFSAVVGIFLWYRTLKSMPIAEGAALNFTGPIFTVLGASLFLKEKISFTRMLSILMSLIGAFVISRPDLHLNGKMQAIGWLALLPLSSAAVLAANKLLTRKLASLGETPSALAGYLLLLMTPISFAWSLFDWITPSLMHWPWLILLGALAAGAHLSFAKAYQLAEVSFLTPIGFSKFFLNMVIGFFAFSEFPNNSAFWVGTLIILCSLWLLNYKMSLYSIAKRFRSSWFKNSE